MSVYVVAQGRIEKPDMLARYVAQALPTIAAHGGRVVAFEDLFAAVPELEERLSTGPGVLAPPHGLVAGVDAVPDRRPGLCGEYGFDRGAVGRFRDDDE